MWFKNRSLRVKMVKDDENTDYRPKWSWTPTDYNDIATTVARSVASVIAIYVAADAVRKVVIYATTSKL